jgi:hypothetical protein
MILAIVVIPLVVTLIWLLSIRPYCQRNRKGHTPGANIGVTFWVDWQEAGEIAKAKGDEGMILVCRMVLWLQVLAFCSFLFAVFSH